MIQHTLERELPEVSAKAFERGRVAEHYFDAFGLIAAPRYRLFPSRRLAVEEASVRYIFEATGMDFRNCWHIDNTPGINL